MIIEPILTKSRMVILGGKPVYLDKLTFQGVTWPGCAAWAPVQDGRDPLVHDAEFPAAEFVILMVLMRLVGGYNRGLRQVVSSHPAARYTWQAELWLQVARDAACGLLGRYPAWVQVEWDRVWAVAWQRQGCPVPFRTDGASLRVLVWTFGPVEGWGQ